MSNGVSSNNLYEVRIQFVGAMGDKTFTFYLPILSMLNNCYQPPKIVIDHYTFK
jgi:hypothetical protein